MNEQKRKIGRVIRGACMAMVGLIVSVSFADTQTRVSSFEYGGNGVLTKEIVEPNSPNDCLQTTYGFDDRGNKTTVSVQPCVGAAGDAVSSASVRTASTSFGTEGRFPVTTSNALGQSETKSFDSTTGALTSLQGPNGIITTWQNDGLGRKIKETRADRTYTTWQYLLCSQSGANCPGPIGGASIAWVLIEQAHAVNGEGTAPPIRQFHDVLGRIVRTETTGWEYVKLVQDTEYDTQGRVTRKSDIYAMTGGKPVWTTYSYDALGRTVQESTPDPASSGGISVTRMSYNGLSTAITNSKGQIKTTLKNAHGQVAKITDARGGTVEYSYDAQGNLTQTKAGSDEVTTLTYDRRGRKVGMTSRTVGVWGYRYNAFGEIVWQRDSLGQVTTTAYDALGRMTKRSEPDLVSQWSYDKKFDGSACGKGIGKLCEAKAANGYQRTHEYDNLGRLSKTAAVLDNAAAPDAFKIEFDLNTGLVSKKFWPTGHSVAYSYAANGLVSVVTGGNVGEADYSVFAVQEMDAHGRITKFWQGNGATTVRTFDGATGRLTAQNVTGYRQISGGILTQTYTYDSLSNLLTRLDTTTVGVGLSENFSYDVLNRLTEYTFFGGTVTPPRKTQVMYDEIGNITYKSDVGRYFYDSRRRQTDVTLDTAAGATVANSGTRRLYYSFDDYSAKATMFNGVPTGNGNIEFTISDDQVNKRFTYRRSAYTSFNMPSEFSYGNWVNGAAGPVDRRLNFVYGPEHQRIRQQVQLASNVPPQYSAGTTWYLNGEDSLDLGYEREVKANGATEHRHFISAGGIVFSIHTKRSETLSGVRTNSVKYLHHDNQGSVASISEIGRASCRERVL